MTSDGKFLAFFDNSTVKIAEYQPGNSNLDDIRYYFSLYQLAYPINLTAEDVASKSTGKYAIVNNISEIQDGVTSVKWNADATLLLIVSTNKINVFRK